MGLKSPHETAPDKIDLGPTGLVPRKSYPPLVAMPMVAVEKPLTVVAVEQPAAGAVGVATHIAAVSEARAEEPSAQREVGAHVEAIAPTSLVACPRCQATCERGSRFCAECGMALDANLAPVSDPVTSGPAPTTDPDPNPAWVDSAVAATEPALSQPHVVQHPNTSESAQKLVGGDVTLTSRVADSSTKAPATTHSPVEQSNDAAPISGSKGLVPRPSALGVAKSTPVHRPVAPALPPLSARSPLAEQPLVGAIVSAPAEAVPQPLPQPVVATPQVVSQPQQPAAVIAVVSKEVPTAAAPLAENRIGDVGVLPAPVAPAEPIAAARELAPPVASAPVAQPQASAPAIAPNPPMMFSPPAYGASATPAAGMPNPSGSGLGNKITVPSVKITGSIVQLGHDGEPAASYPLMDEAIDVGSREGLIVLASDHYLSPRHARFLLEGGRWVVRDLGSVNGVYRKVREATNLVDGDLILLGQQVLRFETVTEAEQGLKPAVQHGVHLFGSPAKTRLARLTQRTVEGVVRDVYHLHRPETSVGRETADIVFTDDPFLSRRHAVFRYDAHTKQVSLEDVGSYNGTFVAIRGVAPLTDGDMLRMGLHMFRIELSRKGNSASAGEGGSVAQGVSA